MEALSSTQITERGNRRAGDECLLKPIPGLELYHYLTLTGVDRCHHISCVTPDQVWVSDEKNLIFANTDGVTLHRVGDSYSNFLIGLHTVNSKSELIYIDAKYNIKKLSKDMKTTTTLIERTDSTWRPRCVYWSPSTGDLLVGMYKFDFYWALTDTETGRVIGKATRYNQSGQLTQTIQHSKGRGLRIRPTYITENNNGDIVVSDCRLGGYGTVVVTEHGGRHRFSYTGPPSESKFWPCGICIDSLSHILVCDRSTNTIQLIDKDGLFLSFLLTISREMGKSSSLSYDIKTQRLWVGSDYNNKLCVYRYITRQEEVIYQRQAMVSPSGLPTTGTEKPQRGYENLLKLMSCPELYQSVSITGVDGYRHISCVPTDGVWVSDGKNLVFANTGGVIVHRVDDSYNGLFGVHAVNSKSELIYIDAQYNIKKLSKNMKTTTTFVKGPEHTTNTVIERLSKPLSVYWSPSTGDLLVGMIRERPRICNINRYNQSGQLTQTIQHNRRRALYNGPLYITENNNGDVVVSDCELGGSGAVVVTERGGRYRFSYKGPPLGFRMKPRGICTDALSHILVCDRRNRTVQMLNKDGQFLSHLLTKSQEMDKSWSLSYDVNTHRLWVGSFDSTKLCVYKYITRQEALTGKHTDCSNEDASPSSISA